MCFEEQAQLKVLQQMLCEVLATGVLLPEELTARIRVATLPPKEETLDTWRLIRHMLGTFDLYLEGYVTRQSVESLNLLWEILETAWKALGTEGQELLQDTLERVIEDEAFSC